MATNYEKLLEQVEAEHTRALGGLAAKLRTEVILPLCKKHGLNFLSGNNNYAFYTTHTRWVRGGEPIHIIRGVEDTPVRHRKEFKRAFHLLSLNVSEDWYLGFFVENVYCGKEEG
jgi:hypothetical protein